MLGCVLGCVCVGGGVFGGVGVWVWVCVGGVCGGCGGVGVWGCVCVCVNSAYIKCMCFALAHHALIGTTSLWQPSPIKLNGFSLTECTLDYYRCQLLHVFLRIIHRNNQCKNYGISKFGTGVVYDSRLEPVSNGYLRALCRQI